jgi:hypothetical protein
MVDYMGQSPQSAIEVVPTALLPTQSGWVTWFMVTIPMWEAVCSLSIFVCSRPDMQSLVADLGGGSVKDNKLQ